MLKYVHSNLENMFVFNIVSPMIIHFTNGDMAYDLRKDGSLPTLGGKPCATLKDAIKLLRRDPKVKANVTFSFRKSNDPSLIITL